MKKRYIFFNTLILICSLFLFLIVSLVSITQTNTRNMEGEIKNYLSIVEKGYDGTNMEEICDNVFSANNKLRITFISQEGIVLYDTSEISEQNHLSRPEINSLGSVFHRYSETTGTRMFYVASFLSDYSIYIRIAMEETSITDISNTILISGTISIIVISTLSFIAIWVMSNKAVEPLKKEVSKLSDIVGNEPDYEGNNIEQLSFQIDKARDLIEEKIETIEKERKKINYIIDNISSGLLILNGEEKVILVNQFACEVIKKNKEDILNKDIFDLSLNKDIYNAVEKCINEEERFSIGYIDGDKEYIINISSLKASFVRVDKKYGVSLFIYDVTESKKIERMKTDFFANASHELKSPLTSIIGYQQMIAQKIIVDPDEIQDATEKTVKEAQRMSSIINEMLQLYRLETKKNEDIDNCSIAKIVDEILSSNSLLIDQKNISVIKIYSDFETTISNSDLYHIIRNLIDNAIKYNKENGSITIKINSKNKTFEIEDTGIGIAKENLDRIFERFFRVDKIKSQENGGTGLGLAIVKHICINNNLKIKVDSVLGKGSKFTITFPN
ncbi:MAG: ATP-binding protein [Bacilli bacterium]